MPPVNVSVPLSGLDILDGLEKVDGPMILEQVIEEGGAHIEHACGATALGFLRTEIDTLSDWRHGREASISAGADRKPIFVALRDELGEWVRQNGQNESQRRWRPTNIAAQRYSSEQTKIGRHRDIPDLFGVVGILTVRGEADFLLYPDPNSTVSPRKFQVLPGSLVLLRGQGWNSDQDHSPYHAAKNKHGKQRDIAITLMRSQFGEF